MHVVTRLGVLIVATAAAAAHGQELGNLQSGLGIARQVCGECHAIEKGVTSSPNARSPTFSELANAPGMTAAALNVALTTPHAGMPMFVLNQNQREDITAYILSLKAGR